MTRTAALLLLALAGCQRPAASTDATPAADQASGDTSLQASGDSGDQAGRPSDPHEERAPMVLTLVPLSELDGVLQLEARIDASRLLKAPVTLSVELPPGATLTSGDRSEEVNVRPGRTTRTFRIEGRQAGTVKVVAHVASRSWGAHAERLYPEPPPQAAIPAAHAPQARPPFVRPARPVSQPQEKP
jgi:hypothetical protein